MSDKLDMSLDDISKTGGGRQVRGRGRAGRRGGGGGGDGGDGGDDDGVMPGDFSNPLSRDNNDLPNSDRREERSEGGSGPVRRQRKQRNTPYSRGSGGDSWKRDGGRGDRAAGGGVTKINTARRGGAKVLVTNLDSEVNEDDLVEIFEQVGALKEVSVTGQGTANVTFNKAADAAKAVKEYDAAEVDGRAMYLRLLDGPAPRSVVTRGSGGSGGGGGARRSNGDGGGDGKESLFGSAFDDPSAFSRPNGRKGSGGRAGRRGGRGGRGGGGSGSGSGRRSGGSGGRVKGGRKGGRGGKRAGGAAGGDRGRGPTPTNESLDSDLDSYFKKSTPAAASADGGTDGQPPASMEE